MVTILPKEEPWYVEPAQKFATGLSESYQNRSDEMALQKAIGGLGNNASPIDILNAVLGTQTYNNTAKQNLFTNYLSAAQNQQTAKSNKKAEEQRDRALDIQEKRSTRVEKAVASQQQIKAGLQTVKEMRDIGKKGNLGIGTSVRKVFSGDAAKDAGQYEQLGKSLIALSTTIPIRNRLEFETLAEKLYDPSIRDKEREGVLDAMENILNRSLIESDQEVVNDVAKSAPEGKIRVRNKETGKTGSVTPYEGMDAKYDRI